MNRNRMILLVVMLSLLVAAVVAVVVWRVRHGGQRQPEVEEITYPTNLNGTFDGGAPPADTRFVGAWVCLNDPNWHRVYYDDYEGEGYYWGKEWHEDEDVKEEDLTFHGNGWFRWKVEGKSLQEMHCMDEGNTVVPKRYNFSCNDGLHLRLTDCKIKNAELTFRREDNNTK